MSSPISHPRIPDHFRDARTVFLGNIDPVLQLDVLEQVRRPELIVCDTMNFWIDGSRDALIKLLERVHILMVNDAEARQLADDANLLKAARWIQARGPEWVVVKKGEHGAILFGPRSAFFVPGYPLEQVFDPTGAGGWVRRRLRRLPRLDQRAQRRRLSARDGVRLRDGILRGGGVQRGPPD